MPISQNAVFTGRVEPDPEFDHPRGAALARDLQSSLQEAGWAVSKPDDWRDCGWSMECSRENARFEVVLSGIGEDQWMLQVAPWRTAGFLCRMFGAKTSASPAEVLLLARAVHDILSKQRGFSDFQWRWDGFPGKKNSTPEPASERQP